MTLDLNEAENKELDELVKGYNADTKAAILRKAIKVLLSIKRQETFLSTCPDCPNKIPTSII